MLQAGANLMQRIVTIMWEVSGKLCLICWDGFTACVNVWRQSPWHALFLRPLWPKQWHFHCLAKQEYGSWMPTGSTEFAFGPRMF